MKNSNKKVPENFEKCLKDWKLPPSSASDIFEPGCFSCFPFGRVNTVEKEIPLNRGFTTVPLNLSKLRKRAHNIGYSFVHFGMIQVGLKPTKLGSNTSAIIQLRDKRYIEYEVSVLSKAESSLCDGPIYFTYFPGHCVGLGDSSDSFTVDVKIKGSGGNESVVLMYKFHYQVVNRPYLMDYSADFPIDKRGKTTLYLAKIAEGDRVVSKTISWGETETAQGSGTAVLTAKGHVVKVDVPGFKKEEVKVVVEDGGVLQISAERSEEEDCKERSSGILRRLSLPESVDLDEMKACMENGVLTITVPKEDAMRKKQVKIIEISGFNTVFAIVL